MSWRTQIWAAGLVVLTSGASAADGPPVGRSLFEALFTTATPAGAVYRIPFPFAELGRSIAERVPRTDGIAPLARVLIPMGRSLQRDAAKPAYFKFPRAVIAVQAEANDPAAPPGPLLRDRLYLGYQEKARIIEVISYNPAAGRCCRS